MPSNERQIRKTRVGVVVSDKMDKTITVKVDRILRHALYNKLVRTATKFKVHDEKGEAKTGDVVKIQETRPMSKTKRWRLVEILEKGAQDHLVETKPTETEK